MPKKYICQTCKKEFNNKSNYEKHRIRKESCGIEVVMVMDAYHKLPVKRILKRGSENMVYGNKETWENPDTNTHHRSSVITIPKINYDDNLLTVVEDGNEYRKCRFCGKKFIYSSGIAKHFREGKCALSKNGGSLYAKNPTGKSPAKTEEKKEVIHQVIYNTVNYITNDNKVINNNVLQQSINNPTYNTSNILNQTFNINAWGKENLQKVSEGLLKNAVFNPEDGIINLIKHVHFNPETPENSNLRLKKKKTQVMEIFDGDNWIVKDKDTIIHNLLTDKKDLMDEQCDKMLESQKLNGFVHSNYGDFSKKLENYLNLGRTELDKKSSDLYKNLAKRVMDVLQVDYEQRKK